MGEKDHTQKMLIGCRDVFAELINVLVYSGEKVVNETDLLAGPTESLYIGTDKQTHQQFRDCSMYELHNGKIHTLYNLILDYLCDRESLLKRNQTMKHPEEVIRMLHALTGDDQYLNSIPLFTSPAKKGESTVCDLINSYYTKGVTEGHNTGLIEGRNQVIQALISNCKDLGCSFENTLDRVKNSLSLSDDEALEDMKLYW